MSGRIADTSTDPVFCFLKESKGSFKLRCESLISQSILNQSAQIPEIGAKGMIRVFDNMIMIVCWL